MDAGPINFITATDGVAWANFLQSKLCSDDYKITSSLHSPSENGLSDLFQPFNTCAVLVSPSLLDQDHASFWTRCVPRFHSRTVILFLGVDRSDLRQSEIGGKYFDQVIKQPWLEVDGTRDAVTNALVKLIEAYESAELSQSDNEESDNEDMDPKVPDQNLDETQPLYDYPPPPRQQNSILKIIPDIIYEQGSHEVLVLMERDPEGTVTMATEPSELNPARHIVMKRVSACAYIALLPDSFIGTVQFMVLAGNHCLGNGCLLIQSRMEQLQYIFEKETSPLTLLWDALGMSELRSHVGAEELDSLLAKKLSVMQLPPSLQKILISEELSNLNDHENIRWPTLLHFAAEYNLSKVCDELLRYPGMIHAACTENCYGKFPCQLAEHNGHRTLQKKLVQYVQDMKLRRDGTDSGISMFESPPPAPHKTVGPNYVNEKCTSSSIEDDYIDMVPPKYGYAKPRSYSEGSVKTPYAKSPSEARIEEEDSDPPPLQPKIGRSLSSAHDRISIASNSSFSHPLTGQLEDKQLGNRSAENTDSVFGSINNKEDESSGFLDNSTSNSRPTSQASSCSLQSDGDGSPNTSDRNVFEEPKLRKDKKKKSVSAKISVFLNKIKSGSRNKQSSSDSDLQLKGQQKFAGYPRISTMSTSSDPSHDHTASYRKPLRKAHSESERDSGAVCDDQPSPVMLRGKDKNRSGPRNSGKRNGTSMQRRQSVRVLKAQNEEISVTPTLPARESKETFQSFIK